MMPTPPCEPSMRPEEPASEREDGHAADDYRRVVQSGGGDRILCGQAEDDREEANPGAADYSDDLGAKSGAQIKRPTFEVVGPD